jgi:hypothetical protein
MDLGDKVCNHVDCIHLAQDTELFVNTVTNL